MAHIEVNLNVARTTIASTRNLINSQLAADIARYQQLENRLNKSRGAYRNECVRALRDEARTLESIRRVYAVTLRYLENAAASMQSQDQALSRSIGNIQQGN
jgi:hypothetical protein